MSRHPIRLLVAVAFVLGGVRWVWNSNDWSGPVVMRLDSSHGVHLHDWLTLAMWAVAFAVACPIWVRTIAARARRAVARRDPELSGLRVRPCAGAHHTPSPAPTGCVDDQVRVPVNLTLSGTHRIDA